MRLGQSRALYEGFQALKEQQWDSLDSAQRRIVDEQLRDFIHSGVALEVCSLPPLSSISVLFSSLPARHISQALASHLFVCVWVCFFVAQPQFRMGIRFCDLLTCGGKHG